ncbi:membrane associated rhomboid family serine protease [Gracilibacillus halotolerans]|uniref:Membrane associated rhomboid family serine protease n=1 Tax=Gracilibacillus halotolerans TaxID=74386 RepID=A0A841RQA2_9BACI|nr:rhomboid family intramembrane serine protease [Gracilibacillus halotolerans]MBB6513104.1 membrane associated rhomboid family serine protease [Gracilibacillus halotolerans]
MFIRTEGFKDFFRLYPLVSIIVSFQIGIAVIGWIIPPLGDLIMFYGAGHHFFIEQGEYWRFLTPIFLHSPHNVGHILFNSFALILFAPPLEQMLGKLKFLFVYLSTGVLANILTFFVEPTPYYSHVGASGAIFGILGLYFFMVFFEKRLISQSDAKLILIITIISLVMTFLRPNINILGHLFGLIAGFALGPILLQSAKPFNPSQTPRRRTSNDGVNFDPNRWQKKRYRYRHWMKPIVIGIFILLVLIGILSNFL